MSQFSASDPTHRGPRAEDDPIVMVPVPRSRLADVYAALGRRSPRDEEALRWQPIAVGLWRSSSWVAREVVRPAAREFGRQEFVERGENLAVTIGRSARALFVGDEPPPPGTEPGDR